MCLVPVKNSHQLTTWIKLKVAEQCQKLKLERNSLPSIIQNYSNLTPILGTSILHTCYPYKFHPALVLMSTTDKIRVPVHIVVTLKITLMFQNTTIVLHLMFYKYIHNCTLTILMLIFRVPNCCICTSVLEGTVYISHGVQDINIQLFKTILALSNTQSRDAHTHTHSLMMNPLGLKYFNINDINIILIQHNIHITVI